MPFTSAAWDAGQVKSSQDAAAYCRCCLIDTNSGEKVKDNCKLPVRSSPGGPINLNAMGAAAGALAGARGGLDAPADVKRRAARKLARLYREAGRTVPQGVLRVAR
jgi:hypothetical protein